MNLKEFKAAIKTFNVNPLPKHYKPYCTCNICGESIPITVIMTLIIKGNRVKQSKWMKDKDDYSKGYKDVKLHMLKCHRFELALSER